jgi:Holliday junction resolvase RusA-like endonuclease
LYRLEIKPLSVNDVWRGRRFKTPDYRAYEQHCFLILPNAVEIPEGRLELKIRFCLSSAGGDIDNPTKPILDILQKKYGFNDSRIYRLLIEKVITKKGGEFVEFSIGALPQAQEQAA